VERGAGTGPGARAATRRAGRRGSATAAGARLGVRGAERNDLHAAARHLHGAGRAQEIVGFDLVEVNPLLDAPTGITSYLAAHRLIEFLGRICDQSGWRAARDTRAALRQAAARPR
jgi:Arginase family